ncbi:MAG: acetyl-CoA carboxylase biotin carboxyl carrier protein subunit, partial [bacterium]
MSNLDFLYDGEAVTASCDRNGSDLVVQVGEKQFTLTPAGDNLYSTMLNGHRCIIGAVREKGTFHIDVDSVLLEVSEPSEDGIAGGAGGLIGEKDKIFAPMPGKIVKIQVAVGDAVVEKQPMVIVEAMKMENQVISRAAGTVKAVNFAAGDQVDTESPI